MSKFSTTFVNWGLAFNAVFVALVFVMLELKERFEIEGAAEPFWLAYLLAFTVPYNAVAAASMYFGNRVSATKALLMLFGHGVTLILFFAKIYDAFGLNGQKPGDVDFWTGLYFSIVTWTTLGYGDFAPREELRLVAAWEAILGLMFVGVLIGVSANILHGRIDGTGTGAGGSDGT